MYTAEMWMATFPTLRKYTLRVPIELLNHRSSIMIRSLIVSFRLVVITYVAVVAIDIAATATIVSKRLLKTGVIPRLPDRNPLISLNLLLHLTGRVLELHIRKASLSYYVSVQRSQWLLPFFLRLVLRRKLGLPSYGRRCVAYLQVP